MKISVYWIVKNEEKSWAESFDSVIRNFKPDEVVVADTGSTDDTVAIVQSRLKEWGGEYKFNEIPWTTFADTRNRAIAECTGDWIWQMDADEFVASCNEERLRETLAEMPEDIRCLSYTLEMFDDSKRCQEYFNSPRILKNGVRYGGAMHNYPDVSETAHVLVDFIKCYHCRSLRTDESRAERNEQRSAMAEKYFVENIEKDPNDRRSRFYLGSQYISDGKIEEGIVHLEEYLKIPLDPWKSERYQCALYLARAYRAQGRHENALDIAQQYMWDHPYRMELPLMIGDIYRFQAERDENEALFSVAAQWYRHAHMAPKPQDPLFIEEAAHTWYPAARMYELLINRGSGPGVEEEKRKWLKDALECGAPLRRHIYSIRQICVFSETGQLGFVQPLIDFWGIQGIRVNVFHVAGGTKTLSEEVKEALEWADLAWFEWAGSLLVEATKLPKRCRIITRVHGFECHTDMPDAVDWSKVDDVIFTAHYLRMMLERRIPALVEKCRRFVVHGGVETGKFTVNRAAKSGNKLCFAGYLNSKKNLSLAVECLYEARKLKPNLELHIAGTWQESRVENHVKQLLVELELDEVVFFHPWQDDLNAFYADKDWFISSSIEESFCYALGEAMAAGCTPLVHCWLTSRDLYPEENIFRTALECADIVARGPDPDGARDYAVKHLDVERNLRRIWRIMVPPRIAVPGAAEDRWRMETKVAEAAMELGCELVGLEHAERILAMSPRADLSGINGAQIVAWHAETVDPTIDSIKDRSKAFEEFEKSASIVIRSLEKSGVYLGGAAEPFHPLGLRHRETDVLWYGVLNERRSKLLEELRAVGVDITIVEEYNHDRLNQLINNSKIVINLHAYSERPMVETRVSEVLSAGSFCMSETLPTWSPYSQRVWNNSFVVPVWVDAVRYYLDHDDTRERMNQDACQWIWGHQRLDQNVERALERIGV